MNQEMLTLAQAAEQLGVHYMTAYRYVRTGRLNAGKERGQWWVDPSELALLISAKARPSGTGSLTGTGTTVRADRVTMFLRRVTHADEAGAWAVITEALTSGSTPSEVHLELLIPALEHLGDAWEEGSMTIAQEHQASATVSRLLGRMTPLFRRPGRRRSTIVLASIAGDQHSMPSAILADLLSDKQFQVFDLGADTPAAAIIETVERVGPDAIVGLCGTYCDPEGAQVQVMIDTVSAVSMAQPGAKIYVGGPVGALVGPDLNIAGWAGSAAAAVELFAAAAARMAAR